MNSGFLVPGAIGPVAMAAAGVAAFSPDQIAGLQLWLKADAITGLADADAITTWTDSSGNGHNATQVDVLRKPIFKTNIKNSLPAVLCDGARYMGVPSTPAGTIFGVLTDSGSGIGGFVDKGDGGFRRLNATQWYHGNADDFGLVTTIRVNGLQTREMGLNAWSIVDDVSNTGAAIVFNYVLGNHIPYRLWQGYVAEIIIYNSALSDADRQAVEAYLSAKYGIALA